MIFLGDVVHPFTDPPNFRDLVNPLMDHSKFRRSFTNDNFVKKESFI